MTIEVQHDENDIACTIVLLKALAKSGGGHRIEVPLVAKISDEGWRIAAIRFLDRAKARQQQQQQFELFDKERRIQRTVREADKYQELNERFDFEEAGRGTA